MPLLPPPLPQHPRYPDPHKKRPRQPWSSTASTPQRARRRTRLPQQCRLPSTCRTRLPHPTGQFLSRPPRLSPLTDDILLSVLRRTLSDANATADLNIAAFLILPGLIGRC